MKLKLNKRCPRCDMKVPVEVAVCPSCQLNYNKFYEATNKEAKQAIKEGNKDQVLMRKGCPSDVKRVGLILLTVFLGFMGAHYYRVGRYKKGIFFTMFFLIGVANAIITMTIAKEPGGFAWEIFTILVLVWGAVLFMWLLDISKVSFNKFKIPVSRLR